MARRHYAGIDDNAGHVDGEPGRFQREIFAGATDTGSTSSPASGSLTRIDTPIYPQRARHRLESHTERIQIISTLGLFERRDLHRRQSKRFGGDMTSTTCPLSLERLWGLDHHVDISAHQRRETATGVGLSPVSSRMRGEPGRSALQAGPTGLSVQPLFAPDGCPRKRPRGGEVPHSGGDGPGHGSEP